MNAVHLDANSDHYKYLKVSVRSRAMAHVHVKALGWCAVALRSRRWSHTETLNALRENRGQEKQHWGNFMLLNFNVDTEQGVFSNNTRGCKFPHTQSVALEMLATWLK